MEEELNWNGALVWREGGGDIEEFWAEGFWLNLGVRI